MQCCLFHQQTVVTTPSNFTSSAGSTLAGRRTIPNRTHDSLPRGPLHLLLPCTEGAGLPLTCLLASSSCLVAFCSSKPKASAWPAASSWSCLTAAISCCLRGERAQSTGCWWPLGAGWPWRWHTLPAGTCTKSQLSHTAAPQEPAPGNHTWFFYSRKGMKAFSDGSGYHRETENLQTPENLQRARAQWGKFLQFGQQTVFPQGLGERVVGYRVSHSRKRYPGAITASLDWFLRVWEGILFDSKQMPSEPVLERTAFNETLFFPSRNLCPFPL